VPDKHGYEWGTGRRKTAVARVRLKKGDGKILINGRDYKEYFPNLRLQNMADGPLRHIKMRRIFDVLVSVRGGGPAGQAGAVMMGLGRALLKAEPEHSKALRDQGFLSRDSRMVERKKPGRPGARKSFQFSKR